MSEASSPSRGAIDPDTIGAIVFDCFGTLADFVDRHFIEVFDDVCRVREFSLSGRELWDRWLAEGRKLAIERGRDPKDPLAGPDPEFALCRHTWTTQFERVFTSLECDGNATGICEQIITSLGQAGCFPEVPEILSALRGRYRLALLSNADEDFLQSCLKRNGLEFELVISSESARCYKPRPAIFQSACDALGLPPARVLYVGDSPIADILGARSAGLTVAWINRSRTPLPERVPAPHLEIHDLHGLLAQLGLWSAAPDIPGAADRSR